MRKFLEIILGVRDHRIYSLSIVIWQINYKLSSLEEKIFIVLQRFWGAGIQDWLLPGWVRLRVPQEVTSYCQFLPVFQSESLVPHHMDLSMAASLPQQVVRQRGRDGERAWRGGRRERRKRKNTHNRYLNVLHNLMWKTTYHSLCYILQASQLTSGKHGAGGNDVTSRRQTPWRTYSGCHYGPSSGAGFGMFLPRAISSKCVSDNGFLQVI